MSVEGREVARRRCSLPRSRTARPERTSLQSEGGAGPNPSGHPYAGRGGLADHLRATLVGDREGLGSSSDRDAARCTHGGGEDDRLVAGAGDGERGESNSAAVIGPNRLEDDGRKIRVIVVVEDEFPNRRCIGCSPVVVFKRDVSTGIARGDDAITVAHLAEVVARNADVRAAVDRNRTDEDVEMQRVVRSGLRVLAAARQSRWALASMMPPELTWMTALAARRGCGCSRSKRRWRSGCRRRRAALPPLCRRTRCPVSTIPTWNAGGETERPIVGERRADSDQDTLVVTADC